VNNTRGRKYEAVDIHAHFLRHADWDGMVALGPARAVSDYVRIMLRRDKCEGEKTKNKSLHERTPCTSTAFETRCGSSTKRTPLIGITRRACLIRLHRII
jgi:hypothetical protein